MSEKDGWAADPRAVEDFIAKWAPTGGAENANFQSFASHLARLLEVDEPDGAVPENARNNYVFERAVTHVFEDGRETTRRIDLYKRDCFIMEGKQSAPREVEAARQRKLFEETGEEPEGRKLGHAAQGTAAWDKVMRSARNQAVGYTRDLPVAHGYPPFILVVDVGHVIDVYADFSGQGKNYAFFPDRHSYRLKLDDLRAPEVQRRLRTIWTDPHALDPARESAAVTKEIAALLAEVSKTLETRHAPKQVAEFLTRCLFTMYAEDVGLLPEKAFEDFLEKKYQDNRNFPSALERLWKDMDTGGYNGVFDATVRRFNGALFRDATALDLHSDEIRILWAAARKNWRDVEPAIFGTLLEQALDARERGQLGAHFTPRAYVERLVIPTVIEPLREDWEAVQQRAGELEDAGKTEDAVRVLRDFHHTLCTTRVLDPACGTGNFLYVSLELMKRLEAEVLEALEAADPQASRLALEGETVTPAQFFGIELNPRAVPIADLVLWIGYLKWQLRNGGVKSITDPVLRAYGNIENRDAILAYDGKTLLRDEQGRPVTRWDGFTTKTHPVTGEQVPDEDARIEAYTYENPRRAEWPEAEFIVGNPPFIGGKDMRAELGDGYAEAAWQARPDVPGGADFVMHFWDEAARRLLAAPSSAAKAKGTENPMRRFGFITTNSITQTFSRRVIERHMSAKTPLSLVFAVADHPWMKATDKAAVRIAMTVARRGEGEGVLAEVASEAGLNSDAPEVRLRRESGLVKANLTLGADIASAEPLIANDLLSSPGVKLHGAGFIVTPKKAEALGLGKVPGLENYILDYRNGRDLAAKPRGVKVIDLYGLNPAQIREEFPGVYAHVTEHVRPHREENARATYRDNWWVFGEPRADLRDFLEALPRYVTTVETAKHRTFQFLDASIRPDNKLIVVGSSKSDFLAALSSRLHIYWSHRTGGWLGVGNDSVWVKTKVFDPFPFPATLTGPDADTTRLAELGERLDAFRKERLADWDWLTMTRLYNALERYREAMHGGPALSEDERDAHERARVTLLAELHDEIDRAVLDAYGWSDLAEPLVGKPGGTTPSSLKSAEQEAAEEELLTRLVALNRERAAEEARGHVRWLRPDYQIPKLGHKVAKPEGEQAEAPVEPIAVAEKPAWPKDGLDQIRVVREVLSAARGPVDAEAVGRAFKGRLTPKKRGRVDEVLAGLAEMGLARQADGDGYIGGR